MVSNPYTGIYDLSEAAQILMVSRAANELYPVDSRKLIRWIRKGLVDRELMPVPGRDLLVSFEDLISFRVIAALRSAGIDFHAIYESESWLRGQTGHARPFAKEALWTEGSNVFVEFAAKLIAASRSGQLAMEFLRRWLIPIHGLAFDDEGVANEWEPADGVVLAPDVQLGSPCISGTAIPTSSVWGLITGGDSKDFVMRSYQLSEQELHIAVDWETRLRAGTRASVPD